MSSYDPKGDWIIPSTNNSDRKLVFLDDPSLTDPSTVSTTTPPRKQPVIFLNTSDKSMLQSLSELTTFKCKECSEIISNNQNIYCDECCAYLDQLSKDLVS